jgi:NAD(P)H-hydrate epimerase
MRALETNAEYFGVSRLQLMENAGSSVAGEISTRFPSKRTRIVLFCGLGGNGGDGFVAARHLIARGYSVKLVVAGRTTCIKHKASLKNWLAIRPLRSQMEMSQVTDSSQVQEEKADIAVDALLGLGLKGIPRQPIASLIEAMNRMQAFRLAIDTPSGLDSDTGDVKQQVVKADLTVTFHKPKPGLLHSKTFVGELLVKDIGLPNAFENFAGPGDIGLVRKDRPNESHKGDFGKLLVVGGNETFTGAPLLVAMAAFRTGIDVVYVAAPEKTAHEISSMDPSIITLKLEGNHLNEGNIPQIKQFLEKATAVVVGPGLGVHEETRRAVAEVVAAAEDFGRPLVLDADGLKAFADFKRPLRIPLVLTPHAGEYSTLMEKELPSNFEERIKKVRKTAAHLKAVLLVKGQTDIISDGERVKVNFSGNPGMTVGGTGDVLAGIVGAYVSQRSNPFEAAVAGAFINGAVGDFVTREKGYHMIPTDLLDWIPKIIDNPMSHMKVREGEF